MPVYHGLHINEHGSRENPAVIFLHGFCFDSSMWDEQIAALQDDFFCITYDIRGMGKTDAGDGQFTMESFVDDVYMIIEEYGLEKPAICGLSMGGYIAFRTVERAQETFGAAIFCDTRATADKNEAKLKRANAIKTINHEGLGTFIDNFLPTTVSDGFMEERAEEFANLVRKAKSGSALGVKGCTLAMQGRTDTWDFLPEINIPTLLICGEEDALSPVEEMRETAERIPCAEFKVVSGSGHMTPIEQPQQVNEILKSFLDKHHKG